MMKEKINYSKINYSVIIKTENGFLVKSLEKLP